MALLSPLSSSTTTNAWSRFPPNLMAVGAQTAVPKKGPKPPSEAPSDWLTPTNYGNPMSGALVKKRLLTLAFDDKEAVWSLPNSFAVRPWHDVYTL